MYASLKANIIKRIIKKEVSWTATRTTKGKNIHKSISNPAKISIPYKCGNTRKIVRQFVTERNNMEIRARP